MAEYLMTEAREALDVLAGLDDKQGVKRYQLPAAERDNLEAQRAMDSLELWMRSYLAQHAEEDVFTGNAVDALKELAPDEEAENLYRLREQLISRMRDRGLVEKVEDHGLRIVWQPVGQDVPLVATLQQAIGRAEAMESQNLELVTENARLRDTLHRAGTLLLDAAGPVSESADE